MHPAMSGASIWVPPSAEEDERRSGAYRCKRCDVLGKASSGERPTCWSCGRPVKLDVEAVWPVSTHGFWWYNPEIHEDNNGLVFISLDTREGLLSD